MCFILLWIYAQERHTCWIRMFKTVCSTWEGMTNNMEESRQCRASRSRGSCGHVGSHFLCRQWHRPWAGIPMRTSCVCSCLRKSVGNLKLCFFYMWKIKVQGNWVIFLCSRRWERTSLVRNGTWTTKKWPQHSKYFDKIFCFCGRVRSFTKSSKQTHPIENVLCVFNLIHRVLCPTMMGQSSASFHAAVGWFRKAQLPEKIQLKLIFLFQKNADLEEIFSK